MSKITKALMISLAANFTEKEIIAQLDNARDYLAALINEGAPIRKRAQGQATVDTYRRILADRLYRQA